MAGDVVALFSKKFLRTASGLSAKPRFNRGGGSGL